MILADHCVYGSTVRLLASLGCRVTRLSEIAPEDSSDEEVLAIAIQRGWVLLTNDKDFGDLPNYPPRSHCGVIVLRISAATEGSVHSALLDLFQSHPPESLVGCLAVVSARKYRLRR